MRGVTIVYATHILDGLDGWPTKLLHVSRGRVAHFGPASALLGQPLNKSAATEAQPARAAESGSLYRIVRARLRAELAAEAQRALDLAATPATEDVVPEPALAAKAAVSAPPPAAPTTMASAFGGSRFDRFGGSGGRQMNMYG